MSPRFLQPLITEPGDHLDPAWSHDGRRIAFTLECSNSRDVCPPGVVRGEPYIALVDVATHEITRIVAGHDPAWSPDDSRLAFTGNASSPGLHIYDFADGSLRQLTTNPIDSSPSWRK